MNTPDSPQLKKSGQEGLSFPKARKYLRDKFIELENDYRDQNGRHSEHCGLIALDIVNLIKEKGGNPQLLAIRGRKVDSINTEILEPKRYSGRVKWGGHTVCENDNIIYDPMVGEPVDKTTYLRTTFSRPAEAETSVSRESMD